MGQERMVQSLGLTTAVNLDLDYFLSVILREFHDFKEGKSSTTASLGGSEHNKTVDPPPEKRPSIFGSGPVDRLLRQKRQDLESSNRPWLGERTLSPARSESSLSSL